MFNNKITQHGRKKGSKNKKTLEKEAAAKAASDKKDEEALEKKPAAFQKPINSLLAELSKRFKKKNDSDSEEDSDN